MLYRHWCGSDVRHHVYYIVLRDADRHHPVLSGGLVFHGATVGQMPGVVGSRLCRLNAERICVATKLDGECAK